MKFKCKGKELQNIILTVEKATAKKTTIPILQNIYVELTKDKLTCRSNNMEMGIQQSINIEQQCVEKTGAILIHSATITNIISKLQNQTLNVNVNESQKIGIQGENVDYSLLGLSIDEYPVFPNYEEGQILTLPVKDLCNLLKHTLFSVSFDETKQFLNGILIENTDDYIYFVSTDGFRLSVKKIPISPLEKNFSIIVPHKAAQELYKILVGFDPEKEVTIRLSDQRIAFQCNDFLLFSRLIQGQFPNFKKVIPSEFNNTIIINKDDLINACERALILASSANNIMRLKIQGNDLNITSKANTLGDFKEILSMKRQKGEENVTISFNVKLVIDVLRIIDQENIKFCFNNEMSPCLLVGENEEDFIYIIMPIRTSDYAANSDV